MSAHGTIRYADEELNEFRLLIESKLEEAKKQLDTLQEQILEITEIAGDEHGGDWMDDSNVNNDVEMLNTMAIRQRKYIKDLENALVRIKNKTYGICVVTGELIDKRRLMAVPTTTKSVLAKNEEQKQVEEKTIVSPSKTPYIKTDDGDGEALPAPASVSSTPSTPKIITRVIRKPSSTPKTAAKSVANDDDDFDFGTMEESFADDDYEREDMSSDNGDYDFDSFADSDSGADY